MRWSTSVCDVTLSAPTLHQLLRTISLYGRWSTSGSDRGIAHFFTTTRNTIEGAGEKRTNEQTNNILGLIQAQEWSYVTLCMCRLTLAWITSENSTTLLERRLIFPHCGWSLSHADWSLCCPVSTGLSVVPRQLLPRVPLSNSLTGVPFLLPVTRDLESKTRCLVSPQNRQRNRLLGGPPT